LTVGTIAFFLGEYSLHVLESGNVKFWQVVLLSAACVLVAVLSEAVFYYRALTKG